MKTTERPLKRKLTPREKEGLERQVQDNKAMLEATSEFSEGEYTPAAPPEIALSKDKIRGEIKRLQKVLDEESPRKVTNPSMRQKIIKERQELEHRFKPYLETHQDLGAIRMDSPEYKAAFKKAQKRPEVDPLIFRWRELGKMLEPDDSEINSLDHLRSDS